MLKRLKLTKTGGPFGLLTGAGVMLAACAVAMATPQAARQPDPALVIKGDLPSAVSFKPADLDKLPQKSATLKEDDGTSANYTGVLLRAALEKAGAPMGKTLRGKSMSSYVVASARDGYQVLFTLAELDASFGNERVLIAYKRDGKPLFNYQGPFRLVCPNDKAGARGVRMLESLEVVRLRK